MRKILRGHVFIKIFLFTLCLGSSFLFEAHAQVSGTFTIDAGSAASPTNFQSFTDAVAILAGGINGPVTFNVQPGSGPYVEQIVLSNIAGTSAANTITFNGNGEVIQFESTNPVERAVIKLDNTDYVIFDNLTVEPLSEFDYGYGFHLLNNSDNNTIRNCHITTKLNFFFAENNAGIVINGNNENVDWEGNSDCDNNLIEKNIITGGNVGVGLLSVPVSGNPGVYMTGNKILNNTIADCSQYGIQLNYNDGTEVAGNDISGVNNSGMNNSFRAAGIFIGSCQGLDISKNRIHDIYVADFMAGIELSGIMITSENVPTKESLIANNLVYNLVSNDLQYGIAVHGTTTTSRFKIYNNTLSLDDQTLQGSETYGLHFQNFDEFDIKNNIITVTRDASTFNYGMYLALRPLSFTSDHNVVYVPDLPGTFLDNFGYLQGNEVENLNEWRTETDNDHFSTDINPGYASLATFNFKPTVQAIDNMAVHVGITTDLDNITRKLTYPDPGCYEFTTAPCATPIVPGNTFSPDTVMCIGPKVAIGVRGNSAGDGQTYTWQTSTSAAGPFTDLTGALGFPYYEGAPVSTFYYRVVAACGGVTATSVPVRILVTAALNSGTYTINSALPTGGINFTSFSDAARALECGTNGHVIFNVDPNGTYNEQMIIPAVPTSPDRTVLFNGNGATIAFEPVNAQRSAVIMLDGADYITIDSLNVEVKGAATNGFGFGIQLINDADHNAIKRSTININKTSQSTLYAGIVMNSRYNTPWYEDSESYCDSNLIDRNTINGGYAGIVCVSSSKVLGNGIFSDGNTISRNALKDNSSYGIYAAGLHNVKIDSNDISHPTRVIFSSGGFAGIWVNGANTSVAVTRNRIHDIFVKSNVPTLQFNGIRFEGIQTDPDKPHMVSNNALYAIKGSGLQHGLYVFNPDHIKFYHNTVSLEDSASKPATHTRGFALFGLNWGSEIEFKNNNIVINRGGTGPKYGIFMSIIDNVTKSDYNNIYVRSNGNGAAYTGSMGGNDFPTLTNWLISRKDTNSIAMDPVYHDIALGDLTPTKIAFENRGISVSIPKDIWDTARNITHPDIGAFEFTICRQLTNPVITVDSTGVNAIRFSWPAIQYTTGYRVSRDGINWTTPSSGAMGLSHTVTGLKPSDTVGLMVKALGSRVDCPEYLSQRVVAQALTDGIYVPNTFTPNGNGQNDVFKVYSNVMKSIRWMVFNQWGEKVFETTELQGAWDGMYKGKPQPVGVYVFVVSGTLSDGTKVTQKGTFNLIR